ncbi:MAG: class I SAM-dependent methyltransferase [Candidatus Omnitrophota bacterium]|nr:class I SAM-dependent methyltransferase [Candidatus Omnitrophota bacterium]
MSDLFDKHYKEYDAWYDENKFAYLSELEAVKKVLPEKGKGLEIGVGSGRFAAPLRITVGIDPSEKMVELARERGVDARLGSGEELPFKDSSFGYVAIIVTLCFVRDPEKVIRESARILKPGGKVIIGIIDKESFLGRFYQKKGSIFYGHARFFGIEEVMQLLGTAGFGSFLCYQTVFDYPDKLNTVENPQEGSGNGGFVVISSVKK